MGSRKKNRPETFMGFERPAGADKFWFLEIFAREKRSPDDMVPDSDEELSAEELEVRLSLRRGMN